jgi:hypothetical protein
LSIEGANKAAANNWPVFLSWLADNMGIYPTTEGMNYAALNKCKDVILWGAGVDLYPDQSTINKLSTFGQKNEYIPILVILADNEKYIDQKSLNTAAKYERMEILKWMRYTLSKLPDEIGADLCIKNNKHKALRFLLENGVRPTETGILDAIKNEQRKILKLLENYNIYDVNNDMYKHKKNNKRIRKNSLKRVLGHSLKLKRSTNQGCDNVGEVEQINLL